MPIVNLLGLSVLRTYTGPFKNMVKMDIPTEMIYSSHTRLLPYIQELLSQLLLLPFYFMNSYLQLICAMSLLAGVHITERQATRGFLRSSTLLLLTWLHQDMHGRRSFQHTFVPLLRQPNTRAAPLSSFKRY